VRQALLRAGACGGGRCETHRIAQRAGASAEFGAPWTPAQAPCLTPIEPPALLYQTIA